MGKAKTEREPQTLRSSQLNQLPPKARELAAQVLERGRSGQWERSLIMIVAVHERRCPGVSRSRSRMVAAEVIEECPPSSTRAA